MKTQMLRKLLLTLLLGAATSFSLAWGEAGRHQFTVTQTKDIYESIAKARCLPADDTAYIHFAKGTYALERPIVLTADDDRPMVFEGDGGEKPVISGGIRLTGWERTKEGWWRCHVPQVAKYRWRFEQLYVNGRRAARARTPNEGWFELDDMQEHVEANGPDRIQPLASQMMTTRPEHLATLRGIPEAELADVQAAFFYKWDYSRSFLLYAEPDSGRFYTVGKGQKPWNPITKNTRFFLENYRAALDAPGEWFLEKDGTLIYIPLPGEDMQTAEVYAPVLERLVEIRGTENRHVSDKQFRNLCFAHTAYYTPKTGVPPQQAAANIDATIQADCADRIVIEDCEIRHTGNYGIWFRKHCKDNVVSRSLLYDLGAGGIKVGGSYWKENETNVTGGTIIDNNIIRHGGLFFPCAGGVVLLHTSNNRVTHNDIADMRYSGVSVGWVWGYSASPSVANIVAYNHIHHLGWGQLSDMGAVYTLGVSPGTRVERNVVHDVYSYGYGGWGLYMDEGSTGIVMCDNLVYRCKSGGLHQHYGKDNVVTNNIFAHSILQQLQLTREEDHRSMTFTHNIVSVNQGNIFKGAWDKASVDMDYNCYYDETLTGNAYCGKTFAEWKKRKEPHSVCESPMFRNPAQGDFTFTSLRTAKAIGFKPFDTSQAGVYGDDVWKDKASMSPSEIEAFERIVKSGQE